VAPGHNRRATGLVAPAAAITLTTSRRSNVFLVILVSTRFGAAMIAHFDRGFSQPQLTAGRDCVANARGAHNRRGTRGHAQRLLLDADPDAAGLG
jgi:hypothetical protein